MLAGNEPGTSTGNFSFSKLPVFHDGWLSRATLAVGHDIRTGMATGLLRGGSRTTIPAATPG